VAIKASFCFHVPLRRGVYRRTGNNPIFGRSLGSAAQKAGERISKMKPKPGCGGTSHIVAKKVKRRRLGLSDAGLSTPEGRTAECGAPWNDAPPIRKPVNTN
jgi:hypothetical protein